MNYVFLNRAAVILSVALSLCPLLFCLPLLFYRIPVPEVIQNKPASQVHGEQDEALRQHAGRSLRAKRSHAVRPRAKPSSCTVGYKALREENNNSCR